jgi:hypothetical protein
MTNAQAVTIRGGPVRQEITYWTMNRHSNIWPNTLIKRVEIINLITEYGASKYVLKIEVKVQYICL